MPVCSPALLAARGRPLEPADLPGLAAALRSGMGRRLGLLVRAPRRVDAGPVAGLGLPPLQHAGRGRGARDRRRHRTPHADRAGVGKQKAAAGLRPPGGGAGALLPHHHGGLPAAAGGAGLPGVDPGGGQSRGPALVRPGPAASGLDMMGGGRTGAAHGVSFSHGPCSRGGRRRSPAGHRKAAIS